MPRNASPFRLPAVVEPRDDGSIPARLPILTGAASLDGIDPARRPLMGRRGYGSRRIASSDQTGLTSPDRSLLPSFTGDHHADQSIKNRDRGFHTHRAPGRD